MSNPESIRRRIAEEEAKLARIEKDREETLARLQELKGRLTEDFSAPTFPKPVPSDSLPFPSEIPSSTEEFSSGRLTLSESIRAASEIPFEVDLVEKKPFPTGAKGSRRK
jgi:outer membrane protein TolC